LLNGNNHIIIRYRIRVWLLSILYIFLFYSSSNSQTWTSIAPQFSTGDTVKNLSSCTFATKEIGWIVDNYYDSVFNYHSRIYKTINGGYSWTLQKELLNPGGFTKVFVLDSLKCWLLGGSNLLVTSDGGINWNIVNITNEYFSSPFGAIYFFNSNEGLIFNQYPWLTTDGGYNWERINFITDFRGIKGAVFADRMHGWIVGSSNPWATDAGIIAGTTDGGYLWKYQGTIINDTIVDAPLMYGIDCIDTNIAFAVGTNHWHSYGALLKTTNGGTLWETNYFYGPPFYDIKFYNTDTGWIAADYGQILETTDGGINWSGYNTGLIGTLRKIIVLKDDKVVYAVGENNVILRHDIISKVNEDINSLPLNYSLSQNYPNPFNPITEINYQLPTNGFVSLKIYDVLGKEVATLDNEYKAAGYHDVEFDATNLSSGVYFYKLQAGNFVTTKKMLLAR
jgi:photosystem II stability/assembly factor-like uncharacterized protein